MEVTADTYNHTTARRTFYLHACSADSALVTSGAVYRNATCRAFWAGKHAHLRAIHTASACTVPCSAAYSALTACRYWPSCRNHMFKLTIAALQERRGGGYPMCAILNMACYSWRSQLKKQPQLRPPLSCSVSGILPIMGSQGIPFSAKQPRHRRYAFLF